MKKSEISFIHWFSSKTTGYIIADIPAAVIDQVEYSQATMLGMRLCTESLLEVIFTNFSIAGNDKSMSLDQLKVEVLFPMEIVVLT